MNTLSIDSSSSTQSTAALKRELKAAEARKRVTALLLITPLAVFLLLIFVVPIGTLLTRAVRNPEVATALPKTVEALSRWDRKAPPDNTAYVALAADMTKLAQTDSMGAVARRLNLEISGYRSLVAKTARAMPLDERQRPATDPRADAR